MLTRIHELDLKAGIFDLALPASDTRCFLLVRWGYHPIGIIRWESLPPNRILPSREITTRITEELGWILWEKTANGSLDDINRFPSNHLPPISVIVCTRDRPRLLHRALAALQQLDYPRYEVVVVDNASSTPATREVAQEFEFRCEREERPGLDHARNCGLAAARYDLIAFTDDDAEVSPGWLRGLAYGFSDPDVGVVTGMTLPMELISAAQNEFEGYGGMSKGFQGFNIFTQNLGGGDRFQAHRWGVGANMAVRRNVVEAIGNFDPALDVGTPTCGGGDVEFFFRAVAMGFQLRYEPTAYIYHQHRRTRHGLHRQIFNNGRSYVAFLSTVCRRFPESRRPLLQFALREWFLRWLIKQSLKNLLTRNYWMARLVFWELCGSLTGLPAYLQSRRIHLRTPPPS